MPRLRLLLLALLFAPASLVKVPPVTRYPHRGGHVVLDWVRLPNATSHPTCALFANDAGRDANLPPLEEPLPAACARPTLSELTRETHECRDIARITYCEGDLVVEPPPPPVPRKEERRGIALCVPVLAGKLHKRWLNSWLAYWGELGATRTSFYVDGLPDTLGGSAAAMPYDWLDVSDWVGRYEGWAHAQLWAAHDCAFRNAAAGLRWAIFVDVDEMLRLPSPPPAGKTALEALGAYLETKSATAATFGSVHYLASVCGKSSGGGVAEAAHRIVYRSPTAECRWKPHRWRVDSCVDFRGRRKAMFLLGGDVLLGIHSVVHAPGGRVVDLNASRVWLRHARGVAFADGDHGVARSCAGDEACESLPEVLPSGEVAAVNCSDGRMGGPLFVHESTLAHLSGGSRLQGIVATYVWETPTPTRADLQGESQAADAGRDQNSKWSVSSSVTRS